MLDKNKSISIASAALLAGIMAVTGVQAGFEQVGQDPAVFRFTTLSVLQLRPGYDSTRPGVDMTVTASIAPTLETTAPVRRPIPLPTWRCTTTPSAGDRSTGG